MMEEKKTLINDKQIAYYESSAIGNPIFFIHGNSAGAEVFKEQLNSNELSNFKCIAFDLPGCGSSCRSENPSVDYTIANLVETITQFIAHFKVEKYSIVAHSLGGHLTLEAAENLKGLETLVIFGTPPLGNIGAELSPFLNNECIPFLFTNELSNEQRLLLLNNLIATNCDHRSIVEGLLLNADGKLREQIGIEAGSGKLKDEVDEFKKLSCKKYILHGNHDAFINLEYLKLLEGNCSDKKIHIIENSTHYPQLENPKQFNQILLELLAV